MNHRPRKRFGQNFLQDVAVIDAILAAVAPARNDNIVEIGPGLGALTQPLLSQVGTLHAVEIDRDLAARLRNQFGTQFPQLTLYEADVLEFNFGQLGNDVRVVGNLPYNISTPLLFRFADYTAHIRDIHVMLQKEVIDRMVAASGDSEYSRLSVMLQHRFDIEKLFDVPPEAFDPAPQVTSAIARLIPLRPLVHPVKDEALFAEIVAAAFAQRRKTLRNSLRAYLNETDFAALEMNGQQRAQELSVAQFAAIADYVHDRPH